MDKALFRAYVKELIKEQLEESVEKIVKKVLPEVLDEAIAEIKNIKPVNESTTKKTSKLPPGKLAEMLMMERNGDTITATTGMIMPPPPGLSTDDPTVKAINKDYSQVMKKLGLGK